jgi:hypothetical protein
VVGMLIMGIGHLDSCCIHVCVRTLGFFPWDLWLPSSTEKLANTLAMARPVFEPGYSGTVARMLTICAGGNWYIEMFSDAHIEHAGIGGTTSATTFETVVILTMFSYQYHSLRMKKYH